MDTEARGLETMQAISKNEINGFTVEIYPDEDASSPRDDDSPGCRLALSHQRYDLPNDAGVNFDAFGGWDAVAAYITETEAALIVVPVYMIDHSGLALQAGHDFSDADPGQWDSGQVGFAYVTPQIWQDTQGPPWTGSEEDREQARRLIAGDVEVYGYYLNGDVYGYTVTDPADGEEVDACWGFYGSESAEQAATASAASLTHEPKCSGTLNTRTGQIEHAGHGKACSLHPSNVA